MMPNALRSVMPRLAAMSRSRIPGSCARNSSTRPWLLRKPQLPIPVVYHRFRKKIAGVRLPDDSCLTAIRPGRRAGSGRGRPAALVTGPADGSELGQLGVRRADPVPDGAEFDEHRVLLGADDPAETVPVVRHQVLRCELLDRQGCGLR